MAGVRRRTAEGLLWLYKHGPSQIFYAFGARCQHTPTCSEYGAECVARFGWWPGIWMALARFVRCRPGGSLGKDPVPEALPDVPAWQPWRYGEWSVRKAMARMTPGIENRDCSCHMHRDE